MTSLCRPLRRDLLRIVHFRHTLCLPAIASFENNGTTQKIESSDKDTLRCQHPTTSHVPRCFGWKSLCEHYSTATRPQPQLATPLPNADIASKSDFYDDNIISRSCTYMEDCRSIAAATLLCSAEQQSPSNKRNEDGPPLPPPEKLAALQEYLSDYIPRFFVKRHDYRIYRPDVVLDNNMTEPNKTYKGMSAYVMALAKLRCYAYLKFANVRMQLLKVTRDEKVGTVMVRWRLSGIPNARAFMFWKFLPWRYSKSMDTQAEWVDGFSTFYVDVDGFIYRHVMDKVIPEGERTEADKKKLLDRAAAAASVLSKGGSGLAGS